MTESIPLSRRAAAEAVGTALLLAVVVGSGIMAERLAKDDAVALLANSIATGTGLAVRILIFGPTSGAHFNPAVTVVTQFSGRRWSSMLVYIGAQVSGAFAGVAIAHGMFAESIFSAGTKPRTGVGLWLGELVATFGLMMAIHATRRRPLAAPWAIGAYITAAYWFTSSTSFANPAVTLARSATDSFTGIRPVDVPAFVAAQFAGAVLGSVFFRWLDETRATERREGNSSE